MKIDETNCCGELVSLNHQQLSVAVLDEQNPPTSTG
jgi:hypothetical protein